MRCPFKWGRWCWLRNTGAGSLLISELVNFTLFPLHFPRSEGGSGWLYDRYRRCQRGPGEGRDLQHRGRRGAAGKGVGATHAPSLQSAAAEAGTPGAHRAGTARLDARPPARPRAGAAAREPARGGGPGGRGGGRGWVLLPPRSCYSARFA